MLGRTVSETAFSGKEFVLRKEKMNAGLYTLKVIDENHKSLTRKIIIQ
jgi:hypothetical protein